METVKPRYFVKATPPVRDNDMVVVGYININDYFYNMQEAEQQIYAINMGWAK